MYMSYGDLGFRLYNNYLESRMRAFVFYINSLIYFMFGTKHLYKECSMLVDILVDIKSVVVSTCKDMSLEGL